MPRNNGISEDWNNGFKRIKSLFSIQLVRQRLIRLRRTDFKVQFSIIPPFHFSIGRLKVKSPLPDEVKAWSSGPEFFTYDRPLIALGTSFAQEG